MGSGGLLVDFGWKGLGLGPGRGTAFCFWERYFIMKAPLSTREGGVPRVGTDKPDKFDKRWGVTCDGLASHLGREAILLSASCNGNRI